MDFEKFLSPVVVRSNLILSSLYLTAYELLKDAIIDNIRDFFSFEYKDGKAVPDERYVDEVTKVHKDLLYASCLWLQRNGVITEGDVQEIQSIRGHRNQIAHELPRLLSDTDLNLNIGYFLRIRDLLKRIEVWWIKEVDVPATPDFDGLEVCEADIRPGRVIALDYVISVILAELEPQ